MKVTPEVFDAAKLLLENVNKIKASEALGLSNATMTYIARADTYDDYLSELEERSKPTNEPEQAPENSQDKTIQILFERIDELTEIVKSHTKSLNATYEAVERIAEPKRRFYNR